MKFLQEGPIGLDNAAVYPPRREQAGADSREDCHRKKKRTFAFTMATSVIGLTATPWVAAVGATLMPAGARHLDGNHHLARE
jgi:hypothetical protein